MILPDIFVYVLTVSSAFGTLSNLMKFGEKKGLIQLIDGLTNLAFLVLCLQAILGGV